MRDWTTEELDKVGIIDPMVAPAARAATLQLLAR